MAYFCEAACFLVLVSQAAFLGGRFRTQVSTQHAQQVDSEKCKFTLKLIINFAFFPGHQRLYNYAHI